MPPRNIKIEQLAFGDYEIAYCCLRYEEEWMGDLFHIVELPNEQIIFLVGKSVGLWKFVGDHLISIEAACSLKPTIRKAFDSKTGLASPAQELNERFMSNDMEVIFCLWGLLLDAASKEISILNAGNNAPLIRRFTGAVEKLEIDLDMPFGILEDWEYKSTDIQLTEDEVVAVFTDGLVDSENGYTTSNLIEQLQRPFSTAAAFCGEVMKEFDDRYEEDQYHHDATLICTRLAGLEF